MVPLRRCIEDGWVRPVAALRYRGIEALAYSRRTPFGLAEDVVGRTTRLARCQAVTGVNPIYPMGIIGELGHIPLTSVLGPHRLLA